MSSNKSSRFLLRTFAMLTIVVGILSLLGVRPMNSRAVEVTLGTAALVVGLILLGLTLRAKSAESPSPIA
jgi:uncharacterized membrane protein HdeD (DUF308 family)